MSATTYYDLNEEKPEYAQGEARPAAAAVLEPLHHSLSFLDSLQSPELGPDQDPFAELETGSQTSESLLGRSNSRGPGLGLVFRSLQRSRTRLAITIFGTVLAWFLCLFVMVLIRTR